jgi:hypothetical protein
MKESVKFGKKIYFKNKIHIKKEDKHIYKYNGNLVIPFKYMTKTEYLIFKYLIMLFL